MFTHQVYFRGFDQFWSISHMLGDHYSRSWCAIPMGAAAATKSPAAPGPGTFVDGQRLSRRAKDVDWSLGVGFGLGMVDFGRFWGLESTFFNFFEGRWSWILHKKPFLLVDRAFGVCVFWWFWEHPFSNPLLLRSPMKISWAIWMPVVSWHDQVAEDFEGGWHPQELSIRAFFTCEEDKYSKTLVGS